MRETEQRSIVLEEYPAMTTPIVNHILFDGMAEYDNAILLGQASDIPEMDPHTKNTSTS